MQCRRIKLLGTNKVTCPDGIGDLLFYERGSCDIETSSLIFSANHGTGFYMIGTYIMKELSLVSNSHLANTINEELKETKEGYQKEDRNRIKNC